MAAKDTAAPATPVPGSLDAVVAVIPQAPEDVQATANAAAAKALELRNNGLLTAKAFTDTPEFKSVLDAAKGIAASMGGDPTIGSSIRCMVQGMTALVSTTANV